MFYLRNFFENLGGRAKKQHKRVLCVFFPEIQEGAEVKHEIYFERPYYHSMTIMKEIIEEVGYDKLIIIVKIRCK